MHCVFQCAFSIIWHGARQDLLFVLNPNKDEVHIIGTLSWIMDRKLVGNLLASVRISSRHSPSWKASSFATKSVLRFWQCLSASARGCALGHSCIFHRTAKAQMLRMAAFEKLQWGNFLVSFQEQSSEAPQNRRLVSKVAYFRSSYCLHIFLCLINRNLQYQGAMVILHCILDHVTNSQLLHTQGKCAQNPLPRMIRHPITATPLHVWHIWKYLSPHKQTVKHKDLKHAHDKQTNRHPHPLLHVRGTRNGQMRPQDVAAVQSLSSWHLPQCSTVCMTQDNCSMFDEVYEYVHVETSQKFKDCNIISNVSLKN